MATGTADDWQFWAGELEVESEPEAEQSRLEHLVTLLTCYLVLKMLQTHVKLSSIVEIGFDSKPGFHLGNSL
ncbi:MULTISPECIES: hypothetical protein [unclassified Microcoleus]|uniref:hypothetical protein n=1 Tax=unclassified Microcoleus TaxID=2642155 RepID=UPI002FCE8129